MPRTSARTRVLIADDDPDARVLVRNWLERNGSFEVVAEAVDGLAALEAARRVRPDLAVLDLAMPRMDGLGAAAGIRELLPETRVVIRSGFSARRMAQRAIDAGADVYVEKGAGADELLAALEGLFPARAGTPEVDVVPERTTELLEAAIISSPVGTVLLDASARLVIANPVADRLLGGALLSEAGPTSRRLRWAETRAPVAHADLPVRAACAGVPFDDLDLFVADGEDGGAGTFVRLSGRPVLGAHGEPVGAVISVLDDTHRKEAERALAATHEELRRSNTELANFASVASHDLLQPLQNISGYAELLQDVGLQDPRAPQHIERIVAGCERMRVFTQDLLAYSRVAASDVHPHEPVDLGNVVGEALALFEKEITDTQAGIQVDPLPTVLGDPVQLGHLFQNLIGNSLTYVARGVRPEIHVHSARAEGGWRVVVDDNGIGIDPRDRERAFTIFERLVTFEQYAGTGIGLALCAKIAERHGGRIWIEDSPLGGTRMCVTFPERFAEPAGQPR